MASLVSGMALAMIAARVMALLVMVSLAAALALALALLPPLALPALVLEGTRVRRLELKTRRRVEASGLVRGWQQQLPRLQGAVAAAAA